MRPGASGRSPAAILQGGPHLGAGGDSTMADNPSDKQHQREREQERERLREEERKDLDVESRRGPRPLEGYAGGHTTWTGSQDDEAAARVHAHDADESWEASE